MTYSYFISYRLKDADGKIMDGMVNTKLPRQIESYEDVVEISEMIARDYGYKQVIINNFIELKR